MGLSIFRLRFGRGATQLGFVDVLTAVILLADFALGRYVAVWGL